MPSVLYSFTEGSAYTGPSKPELTVECSYKSIRALKNHGNFKRPTVIISDQLPLSTSDYDNFGSRSFEGLRFNLSKLTTIRLVKSCLHNIVR